MVVLLGTPLVSGLERQRVLSSATGETCDGAEGSGGGGGRRRPKVGEVYDAQGRRRLHGAFTGGFSAGYYNTVGSAEGWHGSSKFVSSRADKERGIAPKQRQQRPEDFMDEEDDPLLGRNVHASAVYDAGGDLVVRSSLGMNAGGENETALDGHGEPFPSPATASFGSKLLRSLGWRPGQGLGPRLVPKRHGQHVLADGSVELTMRAAEGSRPPPDTPKASLLFCNGVAGLGAGNIPPLTNQRARGAGKKRRRVNEGIGVGIFDEGDIDDVEAYDMTMDDVERKGASSKPASTHDNPSHSLAKMEAQVRAQEARAQSRAKGDFLAGYTPAKGTARPLKVYPVPETPSEASMSLSSKAGSRQSVFAAVSDSRLSDQSLASRFVREGQSAVPREGAKEGEAGKVVSENEGIRVVRKEEVWLPTSLVAKRLGIDAARVERPGSVHSRAEFHDSETVQGPHFGPDQVRAIFDETIEHGDEDTGEFDAQHMEFTTPSAQGATVRFKPRSTRQVTS